MKTRAVKRSLIAALKIAPYPDRFYDEAARAIYRLGKTAGRSPSGLSGRNCLICTTTHPDTLIW